MKLFWSKMSVDEFLDESVVADFLEGMRVRDQVWRPLSVIEGGHWTTIVQRLSLRPTV